MDKSNTYIAKKQFGALPDAVDIVPNKKIGIFGIDSDFIIFYALCFGSIIVTYYVPGILTSLFYTSMLVAYYRSKDESFWLAYFLVISDGLFSFLGEYEATLTLIPGLPGTEVGHFYVLLSVLKARNVKSFTIPFYTWYLYVLMIYLIFLVIQGHVMGLSLALNVQLRVIKLILPFLLFYSIPRLFRSEDQYEKCFKYLFPVVGLALMAQVFTIAFKTSPLAYFGAKEEYRVWVLASLDVTKEAFRGLFNDNLLVITMFGSLFLLAIKSKYFNSFYLYSIVLINCLCAFISATRGYVLAFGFIVVFFIMLVLRLNIKILTRLIILGTILFFSLSSVPIINVQITKATERISTLLTMVNGGKIDESTLRRLEDRGPTVLRKWKESKLTGWGFSDTFFNNWDFHMGNQSMLLLSGVLGTFLLISFFIYFNWKLFIKNFQLSPNNRYKRALLVFNICFVGWFAVHSSSYYFFGYNQRLGSAMIQAIFFSYGALVYTLANKEEEKLYDLDMNKNAKVF
ncbi:MAG: hypothetical protein IPJ74_20775 [Saprospiraceae bacterium]|nr:hypothetical protein [Saprospiraceae bacterium]